jgi:hypothetical protein
VRGSERALELERVPSAALRRDDGEGDAEGPQVENLEHRADLVDRARESAPAGI